MCYGLRYICGPLMSTHGRRKECLSAICRREVRIRLSMYHVGQKVFIAGRDGEGATRQDS